MDVTYILDPLNETQREVVSASSDHALVLAGAGSGKTRVLVHRIAWLVETGQVPPHGILAVTFTNKAAMEMRSRIEGMLNRSLGAMWVGTFHGLAHRMLRLHWKDTDLPEGFQILDSEDQSRMVRRVIRTMGVDDSKYPPKQAQWFINTQKDEGLRPKHIDDHNDTWTDQMLRIYQSYEEACQRGGLVDFAELLLRAHELLRDRDDLLRHYQRRFSHLLVDEFQDTNTIQYAWIRLIAGDTGRLFMVGDDDQSIYGWRGARIENIHRFPRDFPEVHTYRLERNYRSTANILAAANAVIANNRSRLGKNLWTSDENGEPIYLYVAFNEQEEAEFMVERIRQWIEDGGHRDHVAVLYRTSAQSRVFEERLLASGIPYRVHGGLRFYERAEIKDALAYLRLLVNRYDDAAFERVINQPPRGIGMRTLETIRSEARSQVISLWSASEALLGRSELLPRATGAVANFLRLIQDLASDTPINDDQPSQTAPGKPLYEVVDRTLQKSGLLRHYKTDKSDRAEARVENLEELVSAVRQFERNEVAYQINVEQDGIDPLAAFLSHAALEAGEAQTQGKSVHLMTLHAAKGLEFPMIFLCGLEEGLFPHQRSASNQKQLEEERRLCYVGMTRAKRILYLSYAESRRLHGSEYYQRPSRFIDEIPAKLIQEVRARDSEKSRFGGTKFASKKKTAKTHSTWKTNQGMKDMETQWPPGQSVLHPSFGEGVILCYEGHGPHMRVQVSFSKVGTKWLVLSYAKLQAI